MVLASGLIFTDEHVRAAQAQQSERPFSAAWDAFKSSNTDPEISAGPVFKTTGEALKWRLLGDTDAGTRAVEALLEFAYSAADADIAVFQQAFASAQAIACLLDHPAMTDAARTQILDAWAENAANLNAGDAVHLRAWSVLIELCAGILLEQPDRAEMAAAGFRALIDIVQPHGYVGALVDVRDGETLPRTLQFIQGLVLAAEVGAHHGFELWEYERRGVSVMTAALYPLYYYYYPEKWLWDAKAAPPQVTGKRPNRRERAAQILSDYTVETVKPLFIEHGTFLELVNRRAQGSVRAVTLILDELRPITNLLGGGPVTLTHGLPQAAKRRGLFGR
jgi:hypothetical protein